jgi:hypothetical protein
VASTALGSYPQYAMQLSQCGSRPRPNASPAANRGDAPRGARELRRKSSYSWEWLNRHFLRRPSGEGLSRHSQVALADVRFCRCEEVMPNRRMYLSANLTCPFNSHRLAVNKMPTKSELNSEPSAVDWLAASKN